MNTKYYEFCGIKRLWHDKTFDDFTNDKEALSDINSYLSKIKEMRGKGIGLYLYGSNGTGKSHLMNCAFMAMIDNGYKVRLFSMDDIVDQYTSSWYSEETKNALHDILKNCSIIGIDEFGKNRDDVPPIIKRVMESVIRYRVEMKKPIWISSNTDVSKVETVFSEDIASLLNEAVIPVNVAGIDFRKVKQKQNRKML